MRSMSICERFLRPRLDRVKRNPLQFRSIFAPRSRLVMRCYFNPGYSLRIQAVGRVQPRMPNSGGRLRPLRSLPHPIETRGAPTRRSVLQGKPGSTTGPRRISQRCAGGLGKWSVDEIAQISRTVDLVQPASGSDRKEWWRNPPPEDGGCRPSGRSRSN